MTSPHTRRGGVLLEAILAVVVTATALPAILLTTRESIRTVSVNQQALTARLAAESTLEQIRADASRSADLANPIESQDYLDDATQGLWARMQEVVDHASNHGITISAAITPATGITGSADPAAVAILRHARVEAAFDTPSGQPATIVIESLVPFRGDP